MTFSDYIARLESLLAGAALPGLAAQQRMAPVGRLDREDYDPQPADARRSAVLIALYEGESAAGSTINIAIPAIIRATDGSAHSGQIALPGGRAEQDDVFPVGTALREAQEEINLDPESLRVLGSLTPLYIPVSNFTVTPVLAECLGGRLPNVSPDGKEVASILPLSLDLLDAGVAEAPFDTAAGRLIAPCFAVPDRAGDIHRVWGATAMILSELIACHHLALRRPR